MSTALLVQPIDEITVFQVPRAWLVLPQDWREGLGFWYVIHSLQLQQEQQPQKRLIYFGPPRDIEFTFTSDPAQVRAVVLRHDCGECRDAQESAARLLEADPVETVAFVQFTQDYIYPPDEVPPFRPAMNPQPRDHIEVDFEP